MVRHRLSHRRPRFALLDTVWHLDGHLEHFAHWACTTNWMLATQELAELVGVDHDREPVEPHPTWIEATRHGSVFDGGTDPYHLGVHSLGPLAETRTQAQLVRTGEADRRAVLMLDSMVGWYRALATNGASLPAVGERSWHVDVVVRPVGWLGTYRRSRTTGLWFAGAHRHHTPGT